MEINSKYKPCFKCGNQKFIFQEDENKPDDEIICINCYIPKHPTNGWMLSQARKCKEFSETYYSELSSARQNTYLKSILKKLGIEIENEDDSEKDYRKDDR